MFRSIEPARVVLDASGAPYSERYGDIYASRDGALGQARHVFLGGNRLSERWRGRAQFVIVETGFGLGVNFLATWQAWRDDPARPQRLHFVSIEKHPVDAATLLRLAPTELAPLARQLATKWPLALPGVFRCRLEDDSVTLTLAIGDAPQLLPRLVAGADAFFLDGFAPERNPDMWSLQVMKSLARLARDDATLATWCTARAVRDGLAQAGFALALDSGFGHKRQMLRAHFAPRWRVRRHAPPAAFDGERKALVVGGGLAGTSVAWSLARRGWRVQVLESARRIAAGASALPWGLLHPQVTSDDNVAARLSRAGCFTAQSMLMQLAPAGVWQRAPLWRAHGTLVQAADAQEASRWQTLARQLVLPSDFVQFRAQDEAAALLGVCPRVGGWWYPGGAAVAAARLCDALSDRPEISLRPSMHVARLRRDETCWIAEDADGTALARAPVCIVASALDAPQLLHLKHAPVRAIRGRMSLFDAPALGPLRATMSGGATLVRIDRTTVLAGASYEFDRSDTNDDTAAIHEGNLQRLARLLAAPVAANPVGMFDATRCVAHDRLPLAGAVADEVASKLLPRGVHLADLPRRAGLYASFAHGSRGLTLAPLAAEWIAAQLEGEPWPLERDLAARIDVARFLLQAVRRC